MELHVFFEPISYSTYIRPLSNKHALNLASNNESTLKKAQQNF